MSSCHSIMSVCHSLMSGCNQLCLLVIQLCPFVFQLCLLVIQLCPFVFQLCLLVIQLCPVLIQSVWSIMSSCHSILSACYLIMSFCWGSKVGGGRGTEHTLQWIVFLIWKLLHTLICWIGRITGTYSDVNEKNVIQACCTDNILRPKKSLKWPVSQFHLAYYSSTKLDNFAESFFLVWYD